MKRFDILAFDADDTLWENERNYRRTEQIFKELLTPYHDPAWIEERLFQTEMRNMQHFGYGVKAFALSMIETAVELTEGRVSGTDIQVMIDAGEGHADRADRAAGACRGNHSTVGAAGSVDGDHQRRPARPGVEDGAVRAGRLLPACRDRQRQNGQDTMPTIDQHHIAPERCLMVGNSLRSDILPMLALGGMAVYVPHPLTWAHEAAEAPLGNDRFFELEHIGLLTELIEKLEEL